MRGLPTPTGYSPPSPGYLGYASGFSLSCMGFFLVSVSTCQHVLAARDANIPSAGRVASCVRWAQWGQWVLGAAETPWQRCQAAGLFLSEGAECWERVPGGGSHTCGPSTCCCPAPACCPPTQG